MPRSQLDGAEAEQRMRVVRTNSQRVLVVRGRIFDAIRVLAGEPEIVESIRIVRRM